MNRQEMASITSRIASNAEMLMVNNEDLQANAQNAVMIKDQELTSPNAGSVHRVCGEHEAQGSHD